SPVDKQLCPRTHKTTQSCIYTYICNHRVRQPAKRKRLHKRDSHGTKSARAKSFDVEHHPELILTLTAALSAALVLGFVTHRLHLSPVVGYLLAGVAIGPFTPGFVAHVHLAEQFVEIGIVLLMFGVGL